MKYTEIPINTALVDSLRLFVELDKIKVVDYKLITPYQIFYNETAEIIDQLEPPKPVIVESKTGIKVRFNRVVWTHPKTKITTELIAITVSTKLLQARYFEGINKNNYKIIVDYINSLNIIHIDYETFLNSTINDIDFCINYRLNFDSYKTALIMLNDSVKDSKKHLVELYPKKETQRINENFGILFSKRDTSMISSPFVKFYNKTYELINNSTDFYNAYIFPQLAFGLDINNIVRKETTIKNEAHKRAVLKSKNIKSTETLKTLNDLFKLTQNELDYITNNQLKYYYDKKSFSPKSDLSPTEKFLSYYMHELVNRGFDKVFLLQPLNLIECKVTKSNTKKRMEKLIDITFDTDYLQNKLTQNSYANEFLKMQDLW